MIEISFILVLSILLSFLFYLLIPLLSKKTNIKYFSLSFCIFIFLMIFYVFYKKFLGIPLFYSFFWISKFNIYISFYIDSFSLLFCFLVIFIATLIFYYSIFYFENENNLCYYFRYLYLFLGSIIGVFLSSNFLQIFLFWELSTISSFFLISFYSNNKDSIIGAKKSIFINCSFSIFMFIGFLILYSLFYTYDIILIKQNIEIISCIWNKKLLIFSLFLLFFGIFSKSAQGPFYIWLPSAMSAPTPVSSFLHSATMVNIGIYFSYRIFSIFIYFKIWRYFLIFLSFFMIIFSGIYSLNEIDLKGILAYSTVSQLAYIFLIYSFINSLCFNFCLHEAIFYTLNHALFKSCLFLIVGILIILFKNRNINMYGFLTKKLFFCFICYIISFMSMIGLPPTGGFYSKELFFNISINFGYLYGSLWECIIPLFSLISGIITFSYSFKMIYEMFLVKGFIINDIFHFKDIFSKKNFKNTLFLFPSIILCIIIIYNGIFSYEILNILKLITIQKNIIYRNLFFIYQHKNLFFNSNEYLFTLLITFFGYFVYKAYKLSLRKKYLLSKNKFDLIIIDKIYQLLLLNINKFFINISLFIQSGNLLYYIYYIIFFFIISSFVIISSFDSFYINIKFFSLKDIILFIFIIILFINFYKISTTFLLLIYSSIIGIFIIIYYLLLQAFDLAMTQICVEIISTIFIILLLFKIKKVSSIQKYDKNNSFLSLISSIIIGIILFIYSSNLKLLSPFELYSNYFTSNNNCIIHGKNILNLIVITFRGYDTLGETFILVITTISIYFILQKLKEKK